jgi:hypothetical protein
VTATLAPVVYAYDGLKLAGKLSLRPFDWFMRKVNPTYVEDFNNKIEQISYSIKQKRD